ncbi:MAG TPA: hypothetical protein VGD26_05395 [Chitinophagaceae bacterium]
MKKTVLLVILIVVVAGGIYAWREYNRKNPDLKQAKADYSLKAETLIKEFEKDKAASDKKYIGKNIEVTGSIKKIDDETNPVVFFLGNADEMSSVQCSLDSSHASDYTALQKGATVTRKGVVNGAESDELLGTDVKLNRCVVVKNQ